MPTDWAVPVPMIVLPETIVVTPAERASMPVSAEIVPPPVVTFAPA